MANSILTTYFPNATWTGDVDEHGHVHHKGTIPRNGYIIRASILVTHKGVPFVFCEYSEGGDVKARASDRHLATALHKLHEQMSQVAPWVVDDPQVDVEDQQLSLLEG